MSNYQKVLFEMRKFLKENTKELSKADKKTAQKLLIKLRTQRTV